MNENLKLKVKESLQAVLPITFIVAFLCFTIAPLSTDAFMMFFIGAILLIVGMGLFTLGAETSMSIIGERIGTYVINKGKILYIILIGFIIGIIATLAEPDLNVLAEQIKSIPSTLFIWAVSIGVGLFLIIAILRMIFKIKFKYILLVLYGIVFIMTIFVPNNFLSIAFDAGGVTTGPMTVPFLIAFGIGAASIRHDKNSDSDSFGLVALCSIGPIFVVLILGMLYGNIDAVYETVNIGDYANSREIWQEFGMAIPKYIKTVSISLLPIIIIFLFYQIFALKIPRKEFIKILIGILYTFLGLVLFLTGVNIGFMPVGNNLGAAIASLEYNWIIIPLAMLIGYFIVVAEPAVAVLNKQVSDITDGAIPEKAMKVSLSIGVAISLGLSMLRVIYGIPILYFLVPGYIIALILTFFSPNIFSSIAFDAGGVASGSMTATFLLPFAIGACEVLNGNVLQDAFGIVAMVAMTPLITIQILGIIYKLKVKKVNNKSISIDSNEIIEFEWEWYDAENGDVSNNI